MRKTAITTANIYGGQSVDMKLVWCFEFGNDNDKLVKRYVPKVEVYAVPNAKYNGNIPSKALRNIHKDVFIAKEKNLKRYGKFATNHELKKMQETNAVLY